MTYSLTFFLAVLLGIAATMGAISYVRRHSRITDAEQSASLHFPVGPELAEVMAIFLQRGLVLCYRHRDDCGMGLRFADGKFIYGHASDGVLPSPSELHQWGWNDSERMEFDSSTAFVSWLSAQTDLSLSAEPNTQRLTRSRLVKAMDYCMKHDRSAWPSYAG